MIHLKACFNKNIIRYKIIFILLFSTIMICNAFVKSVDKSLETEKNKEQYRTLLIEDNDTNKVEIILKNNKDIIEDYSVDEMNNQVIVLFNNIDDLEKFINKNEFNGITTQPFQDSNYMITRNIFNGILVVINILIFVLIIVFSINLIHNLEKDISLYKLIGYSDKKIIKYLLLGLYGFYLGTYLISIIISLSLLKIIPMFNIDFLKDITIIGLLNLKEYIIIGFEVILVVTLSSINIVSKIKKVTPIKLINSN